MTNEELKAFRLGKNMTQAEFAKYIGLKREKTISEWENGKKDAPAWLVSRIKMENSNPKN